MKKYAKKLLTFVFVFAVLLALLDFSYQEKVEIGQQEQALLQAIQSPEAVQVSQLGRQYSLRQVGFDPEEPQARCLNHSFFQAQNSDLLGGLDTLRSETAVYFTGDPDRVQDIRLSYQTSILFCYQDSSAFSFYPFRLPPFLLTKHFQYGHQQFQKDYTFHPSAEGFPPVCKVYGPELTACNADLKGGTVIGGFSRVSGQIRCKDGTVYHPESTISFSASCYARSNSPFPKKAVPLQGLLF